MKTERGGGREKEGQEGWKEGGSETERGVARKREKKGENEGSEREVRQREKRERERGDREKERERRQRERERERVRTLSDWNNKQPEGRRDVKREGR